VHTASLRQEPRRDAGCTSGESGMKHEPRYHQGYRMPGRGNPATGSSGARTTSSRGSLLSQVGGLDGDRAGGPGQSCTMCTEVLVSW